MPKANKSPGWNPLNLKIGQKIQFTHYSYVEYTENGKKEHIRHEAQKPRFGWIIGTKKRAIGQYHPSHQYHCPWTNEHDYEPASLQVDKYIWFYQIATSLHGNFSLVHPDDIILLNRKKQNARTNSSA